MRKPVFLFDLDGICCNLMKKWLAAYNQDWHDNLTEADITSWHWHEHVRPECGKRIYHYLNRPGFFADLEPIAGCIESLGRLAHICELIVVTASPKEACADKIEWVRRHLPMVERGNIVVTHRKDLVQGTFMFDDAPRNLEHHPAIRLMLDYPYNRHFHDCHRLSSWQETERLVDRYLEGGSRMEDRRAEGLVQPLSDGRSLSGRSDPAPGSSPPRPSGGNHPA